MSELPLHPITKARLGQVIQKPPQALLIYGPTASNKQAIAKKISSRLLKTPEEKLTNHPYFSLITKPEGKQEIPIDAIRTVISRLALKPAALVRDSIHRVVVIDEADKMSAEAQNALLKNIEEPPEKTIFILTAPSVNSVLPTIASRAERLAISPIGLTDAIEYFSDEYQPDSIDSAWRLSGGDAGLMEQILKDNNAHPLKSAVEQAKQLLAADTYNRLLILDSLSQDKTRFTEVLDALSRILAALHHTAIRADNRNQASKLLKARKQVDSALSMAPNNTSGRLLALNLAQQLPL
jgi:DNA polymerase III subunit delta'